MPKGKPAPAPQNEWQFDQASRELLTDILTKMLNQAGREHCEEHLATVDALLVQCKQLTEPA